MKIGKFDSLTRDTGGYARAFFHSTYPRNNADSRKVRSRIMIERIERERARRDRSVALSSVGGTESARRWPGRENNAVDTSEWAAISSANETRVEPNLYEPARRGAGAIDSLAYPLSRTRSNRSIRFLDGRSRARVHPISTVLRGFS